MRNVDPSRTAIDPAVAAAAKARPPARNQNARSSRLTIRIKQPETEHTVSVGKLQAWLHGGAKSLNEQVRRNRLKQLLSR